MKFSQTSMLVSMVYGQYTNSTSFAGNSTASAGPPPEWDLEQNYPGIPHYYQEKCWSWRESEDYLCSVVKNRVY